MEFNLGQLFIKVMPNEIGVLVVPIGEHMLAIKVEFFKYSKDHSIKIDANIYHKDDTAVIREVENWIEGK